MSLEPNDRVRVVSDQLTGLGVWLGRTGMVVVIDDTAHVPVCVKIDRLDGASNPARTLHFFHDELEAVPRDT